MTLEQDDVIKIIRLMDESEYDELHLEMGDLKLSISKSGGLNQGAAVSPSPVEPAPQKAAGPAAASTPPGPAPETTETAQEPEVAADASANAEGLVPIKSPLLGSFYRSAKPESPPFVEVGSQVKKDDTVCLIEVMKTFTTVKAGVEGRIAKICANNSEMVEHQQTLFLVEPA